MTNVFLLGCMGPVHLPISSEVVVYVDCRGWQQMKHSSKREKKQNRIRYLNNYVTIGRNRARGLSRKYSNSVRVLTFRKAVVSTFLVEFINRSAILLPLEYSRRKCEKSFI